MSAELTNPTTAAVIASALQLPIADRVVLINALEQSLVDDCIDYGSTDPPEEVEAAWSDEIVRRIEDIDSGRVKTIPSAEFWEEVRKERRSGN